MSTPELPDRKAPEAEMPPDERDVVVVHISGRLKGVPLGAIMKLRTAKPVPNFFDRSNDPNYQAAVQKMTERVKRRGVEWVFSEPKPEPPDRSPIVENEMPSTDSLPWE